jgi:hypothetical protein
MVFIGFSINYMQRCNLNIAIIDMVGTTQIKLSTVPNVTSECFKSTEQSSFNESIDTETNFSSIPKRSFYSLERHLLNLLSVNISFKPLLTILSHTIYFRLIMSTMDSIGMNVCKVEFWVRSFIYTFYCN